MQSEETLPNGLTLLQDDQYFKLGQDSVLLSAFARIPKRAHVLDLGCGTGALSLLCWRPDLIITGLELQEGPTKLFAQSILRNQLKNVFLLSGDLKEIRHLLPPGSMQYVLCNPPYFEAHTGAHATNLAHQTARQDCQADLQQVIAAMAWVLSTGGQCAIVFRPERLCPLLNTLQSYGFTPKRMRFVHQTFHSPPSAVLVCAKRGAAQGLIVEPPLFVRDTQGNLSAEYRAIYHKD